MKLLVIEDEVKLAECLECLTETGYVVDLAHDGIDGLHLAGVLLASAVSWWQPSHDRPMLTVGLIAGVGVIISAVQHGITRIFAETGIWTLSVLGATVGAFAATADAGAWTCRVSGAGVAYLAWASWQLAASGASFLPAD